MEGIPVIDLVYDAPLNSDLVIEMNDNIPIPRMMAKA
tara:strand:- start:375 stop:485 length:111 start_codon:yes stop_codon:yes gene_type:complete